MKAIHVKPVPVPRDDHPDPPYEQLPKHEFTLGLIAPKGAGKTTTICNLLNFYKGHFHTILVYSPTIQCDDKWDYVKKQKLLCENKPLKKWVKEMTARELENKVVQGEPISTKLSKKMEESFDPIIPESHFFEDYAEDHFMNIMEEQKALITMLKKYKKPKFLANRILIVFDDLVGSSLFNGSRGSYFKGVNTRHRHYSASFLMVSQGYLFF